MCYDGVSPSRAAQHSRMPRAWGRPRVVALPLASGAAVHGPESDLEYFKKCKAQERAIADASTVPFVRNVRLRQAERYAAKIAKLWERRQSET